MTGRVFEIREFTLQDGPGIRTTVFFKGCPLRCAWCHNPEGQSFAQETLTRRDGTAVACGEDWTPGALAAELLKNADIMAQSGGGVTFSGGEPLLQADFLLPVLRDCRAAGISAALESSLYLWREDILRETDFLMADLKLWDSDRHRQYTGVGNEEILKNLRRADEIGLPMRIRTPIIPGVNDTKEEISAIAAFVRTLRHAAGYELLPYHPLGLVKARALGQTPTEFSIPTKEHMEELKRYADLH